jgi:hypothetical protein
MPVVLMSAKSDKIREQFVQQTGAIDAITKPFDAQALVAVIENALRRVNTGRSSSLRLAELEEEEPVSERATSPGENMTKRLRMTAEVAVRLGKAIAPVISSAGLGGQTGPDAIAEALSEHIEPDVMRHLAVALRELDLDEFSSAALTGDIAVIPIGAALQLLQIEGQSGVLVVSNGDKSTEITITLRGGLIDLVQSRGTDDEFRLGRYFVEEGLVTPHEIEKLLAKESAPSPAPMQAPAETQRQIDSGQIDSGSAISVEFDADEDGPLVTAPSEPTVRLDPKESEELVKGLEAVAVAEARKSQPGAPTEEVKALSRTAPEGIAATTAINTPLLGDRLLGAGRINDEQLRAALVRQSSELVYEMLRWQKGRFEFRRRPAHAAAAAARLGLTVPAVVMEGFRRVDEWRVLEGTIDNFDGVLVRDELALKALPADKLAKQERAVLDAVDNTRTIRGIILASHMSSFDVCRVLAQLIEARLVRRA